MKRTHRHWHFVLWLVLGPLIAATLVLALTLRPAVPINDALPPELIQETD